eukprot:10711646-Alexandrium_andersonii.AAC.1
MAGLAWQGPVFRDGAIPRMCRPHRLAASQTGDWLLCHTAEHRAQSTEHGAQHDTARHDKT